MSGRRASSKHGKATRPSDYVMEVVQDLTCPICLEFYTYPIILPCSHVLCRRPCAENIFEINFIRCPVCRDNCYINGGITSLPRVIPLESIIEKVRAERKKRAGLKKSSSVLKTNVSVDSEPSSSSGGEITFRESASSSSVFSSSPPPATSTAPNHAPPSSSPDTNHVGRLDLARSDTCATMRHDTAPPRPEELLNDYQRIMWSLDNPPSLLCRPPRASQTAGSSSPSSVHESSSCSWSARVYRPSSSSNHRSESPSFSATPTNDVTGDSTIDHEIEAILSRPVSRHRAGLGSYANNNSSHNSSTTVLNQTTAPTEALSGHGCNTITTNIPGQQEGSERLENLAPHSDSMGQVQPSHVSQVEEITSSDRSHTVSRVDDNVAAEALVLKHEIQDQLAKLSDLQCRLLLYLTSYRDRAEQVQVNFVLDRAEVTSELDALMAEIESQRIALDEGVNGAEREVMGEANDVTSATEKLLVSTQRLASFAEQALTAPSAVLQQTGPDVLQKLTSSVKTCELCLETSEPSLRAILSNNRLCVDVRRQRSSLRGLKFLKVPHPPTIDLQKCCRSHDTVILVLTPPSSREIVDSYRISYSSEEQKYLGIEETVVYNINTPPADDDRTESTTRDVNSPSRLSLTFALIEHLCSSTRYFFRACAVNKAGSSSYSDLVQCVTLAKEDCVVPVPSLLENLSQTTSSTSAKIVCHGPATVSPHQGVQHFLLFRPLGGTYVWQGEEFHQGREEHTVTRLRAGAEYQFIMLACNVRGEGQVSGKFSLMMV